MAMQTVYFKEHEGNGQNQIGQFSSVQSSAPWWCPLGSPSVYGASCGQLPLSMENPTDQAGQRLDKAKTTHFSFFPGDGKDSGDGQKIPTAISLQPESSGCFELGFGQPMICAKYPYADQYYGVFSAYGAQISGRIMLPLNLATDDGPVYVNAKQYHGIIRRRKSRAKAVLENKMTRKRKPYMHHSRHLHAMRRPRGCGGRFLNKETQSGSAGTKEKKSGIQQLPQPTCSRISEVLQSESGTLGSPKEANGSSSNLSGSEVTSMYSRGDFDHFRVCHLGPSIHSFSGIMDSGRGIVMPSQGVSAADNCCNLKV